MAEAYIEAAQIHVAVILAAETPNPMLLPAVMYPSAFSSFLPIRVEIRKVPP
ncbi:hypothetical protein ACR6C2_07140 [Streptomyces sp. INA 01156]